MEHYIHFSNNIRFIKGTKANNKFMKAEQKNQTGHEELTTRWLKNACYQIHIEKSKRKNHIEQGWLVGPQSGVRCIVRSAPVTVLSSLQKGCHSVGEHVLAYQLVLHVTVVMVSRLVFVLYGVKFIQKISNEGKKVLAKQFNFIFRSIDNALSITNPAFVKYLWSNYPLEVDIWNTTSIASYLDLFL